MKKPTTQFGMSRQGQIQINREFLISEGWILDKENPLSETFKRSDTDLVVCSISLHGGFSIHELHWCNKKPERSFVTLNHQLTHEDYHEILRMLSIQIQ